MEMVEQREEGAWIPNDYVAQTAWTAYLWSIQLRKQVSPIG